MPIAPEAPPLFSTTTVWPSCCCSGALRMRATWSTEPPAGNTATSLIGARVGQACAQAPDAITAAASASHAGIALFHFIVELLGC